MKSRQFNPDQRPRRTNPFPPSSNEPIAAEDAADEQVVARILAGEISLFEILVRRHAQRLYRIGVSILRDSAEAEDVAQETFLKAYRALAQFAGRAKFSTWLARIAVHEALGRRSRAHREESEPLEFHESTLRQHEPSPEQRASHREAQRAVADALQTLPEMYRALFVMRAVEQRSSRETAQMLNITEGNVKVRFHRARKMLQEQLAANF